MAHGQPLDQTHPNWKSLTPVQQSKLEANLRKGNGGQQLTPADIRLKQNLQNLLQNGQKLDEQHPHFDRLRPEDQDKFRKLNAQMDRNGGNLIPADFEKLEKLYDRIQLHHNPFSLKHRGLPNLLPAEKKVFNDLIGKLRDRKPLGPDDLVRIRATKDILRPHIPYDKFHPNFGKLSPLDQSKLKAIDRKLVAGKPLTDAEKPELHRIKDILDDPTPLNDTHPNFAKNLNPSQMAKFRELKGFEDAG